MDYKETIIIAFTSLASGLISGVIIAFINYKIFIKQKIEELNKIKKIESYKSFFNDVRSFLDDPSMNKEELFEGQKRLLKKFYDEIYPFGSLEVIEKINDFFNEVSITYVSDDVKTDVLKNIVFAIRKDLGLKINDKIKKDYKFYTVNLSKLKKEK